MAPLEFVAIDKLGKRIETPRRNKHLLVITDWFSKPGKTSALSSITTEAVAKAFVINSVMTCGSPVWLLSDNGPQFTARFFSHVHRIHFIKKLFTMAYSSQCIGQTERQHQTIMSELRHYIAENPKAWDLLSGVLMYAYNIQVHRTTKCAPFDLMLSCPPPSFTLEHS